MRGPYGGVTVRIWCCWPRRDSGVATIAVALADALRAIEARGTDISALIYTASMRITSFLRRGGRLRAPPWRLGRPPAAHRALRAMNMTIPCFSSPCAGRAGISLWRRWLGLTEP